MRTSDFEKLKVFAAVADRGSFVKAALWLGLSTSSVSQSIRTLEDRIGLRLLNRTTRSVAPTEAGAYLLDRVRPALKTLETAFESLHVFKAQPSGVLRLSVSNLSRSLAAAPAVSHFLISHPTIKVEMVLDEADLLDAAVDAGIRDWAGIPNDMAAVRIGERSRMLAVAAPGYLTAHGRPERPADLVDHNCIQHHARAGSPDRWMFMEQGRAVQTPTAGSLATDNIDLVMRAAVEGLGVAYVIESHARPMLETGTLQPLLEAFAAPFPGWFLYYPSRRRMSLPLTLFAEFLTGVDANRAIARSA